MQEILLNFNHPHFSLETTLFGQNFNLEFELIERQNFWVMHVFNSQELPLALGIKLVPNWPLFSYKNINFMMLDETRLVAYEAV